MQTVKLNDGHAMPQLGLGVWQTPEADAPVVVKAALDAGYRHVDTAAIYGNERGVGAGLKSAGVKREDIFLTTKLWNDRQGYDSALTACARSLERLGTDTLDLYLIHWPAPKQNQFVDSWKALIELKKQGRARSIGVSNFNADHLERIIGETGVVPAVNQVELHPRFQQRALREFHAHHGIATESWSPLGQGKLLADAALAAIAKKHGRSAAQVILRWHLQQGLIVIPKSVTPARIRENFAVFDFALDADDMKRIDALDQKDGRIGPSPLQFP